MGVVFGVLGPVTAWDAAGGPVALKGPRHRAVLARLIVARGRVVPVGLLVDDLWDVPPEGAVGAVRTFVAALRRALEPGRPPRTPPRLLVTEGPGYALRAEPGQVDAWRFEQAVSDAAGLPPDPAQSRLDEALGWWRGPAYADFADEPWARAERSRLAELRLHAVERRAQARLDAGLAAETVPDLDAHVSEHPWRESGWRLLALALYRTGRQADALAVLRRAGGILAGQLGLDPGPELRRMEADVLAQAPGLDRPAEPESAAARLWTRAAADYDRTVAAGARTRLESTVGLLRDLAVSGGGGLEAARGHRLSAVTAAEEFGDPELTARVIGAYDVPAIWTRSDDPELAGQIVAAAERVLPRLPAGAAHDATRARLLATIALEMRGTRSPRGPEAAAEAEAMARDLDDPAVLAFALNGAFMQSCTRAGLAARRDAIGAELVELSARHGLATFEVLGHLVSLQARCALGDFAAADGHAASADRLAERHERPLVGVFTHWYRALRLAASGRAPLAEMEAAYRAAAAHLEGAGMPGLSEGLLPLALLTARLTAQPDTRSERRPATRPEMRPDKRSGRRPDTPSGIQPDTTSGTQPDTPSNTWSGTRPGAGLSRVEVDLEEDWGPYRPWAEPFALLNAGRRDEASTALHGLPEPPADLMYEALCCLEAAVALEIGDEPVLRRARDRLLPAAGELAGAGSGLLTLGPVDDWLARLDTALGEA